MQALSPREYQIARLVASGRSNRQIAEHLVISEQTVKNHIQSIFRKLAIGNRVELTIRVQRVKRRGLLMSARDGRLKLSRRDAG
jgi:DNA-binding NarL/FixJ family response regulator